MPSFLREQLIFSFFLAAKAAREKLGTVSNTSHLSSIMFRDTLQAPFYDFPPKIF
jgi:hypothetical protein